MFDCCSVTPAFVAMAFEMDDVGANGTEVQRSSEPLNGSQAMNAALTPEDALQAPALSAMPETEDPHSQCSLRCLLASSSQTSASANSNKSRTQAKTIMVRTVVACNLLCIYAAVRVWFDQYTRNQEDCHRDRRPCKTIVQVSQEAGFSTEVGAKAKTS